MTQSIHLRCGAIIQSDKEETLLVHLEKGSVLHEHWSVPSGLVKAGEKTEDAMMRIVKEQFGVDVQILKVIGFVDDITKDAHTHFITFLCRIKQGEAKLQTKTYTKSQWFAAKDIPKDASITDVLLPLYILRYITVDDYNTRVDALRGK